MNSIKIPLAFLVALFVTSGPLQSIEPTDIYLLIGQSNMAGRAEITKEQSLAVEGVYLLDKSDSWTPAQNPLNQYSTIRKKLKMQKLGPGYSFAQELRNKSPNTSIGLVVNAKGGSNIREWARGTKFYNEAIRRAKEAKKSGTLRGILWHQGESNAKEPTEYLELLKELIENLRTDLEQPALPFVAGQIFGNSQINQEIARLPETVAKTSYVSSADLTTFDNVHFDNSSQIELGKRYAIEMLKLLD
ncbi:MAG: sialate O-acetylesterase [Opitutales bacterium]